MPCRVNKSTWLEDFDVFECACVSVLVILPPAASSAALEDFALLGLGVSEDCGDDLEGFSRPLVGLFTLVKHVIAAEAKLLQLRSNSSGAGVSGDA